ncbi:MAG: hypothetical protein Q8N51_03080, partial [Gammaproteobacteria bacterium]|nr:hypothetical protein [Gammaproteobacteria bacterium]
HFRPNNPVTQGTTNLSTASFCSSSVTEDAAYFRLDGDDFLQDWTNRNMIVTSNVWTNVPFMTGYRGDRSIGLSVNPATLLDFGTTTQAVTPDFANGLTSVGGIYEMEDGPQINDDPTIALVADATFDAPNILLRVNTRRCTNVQVSWRLRDLNPTNTATVQPVSVQARVGTSGNFTSIYSIANANNGGDIPGSVTLATTYNDQERVQIRWMTTNAGPTNSTPDNMIGIDDIKVSGTCTPPPDGAAYYQLKNTVTLTQDAFGRITTPSTVIYDVANWERVAVPASQRQNFANWFSYYRNRTTAAVSAMSRAFAPFDGNIRVVWQNLGNNAATAGVEAPVLTDQPIYKFADEAVNSNVRTRFYNWLFQIPASGGTPNIAASVRVGEYFKRAGGAVDNNPYWDRDLDRELSCRQNFHINMSDGFWNGGNPHVGGTVANRRYVGTSATLPDGRAYNPGDAQTKFFNRFTGTAISPTMTDVMFHYWASDLRPDFTAAAATRLKVPPFIPDRSTNLFGIPITSGQDPRNNLEVYWNPANDPASWSHLVNFNISFGLDGTLPNTPEVLRELRLGTSSTFIWPYPVVGTDDGRKLDDFWHAALASRGRFLSAQNPEQLITVLQEVIASINARRGASTAVSVSLPIITDGTTGYT